MATSDPVKSIMKWTGLIIALGTVAAGILTGLGSYVFATKGEVTRMEKRQVKTQGATDLRDYRIQKLEVQVQNVESIARRTDVNVEKLLTRRSIQPAPAPTIRAMPRRPTTNTLDPDPPGD